MDFGIGPAQVLLLKAALSPHEPAALAAFDEWWERTGDFGKVQGTDADLLPQIYVRLGPRIADRQLAERLKGAARHRWVLNQNLVARCAPLVDILTKAEIPVLLLKGAAIAALIPGEPGLRRMGDWDVLVPRGKAIEALDLLRATGLEAAHTLTTADLASARETPLLDRKTRHPIFDLHWRPLHKVGADELTTEMFESGRPVRFAGRGFVVCGPEHLLFHVIVNGAEWSRDPRYEWLIDTVKVLRWCGPDFDWTKLADVALRYGYGFLVGASLAEAKRLADVAVPAWVLRRLCGRAALLERWEARLSRKLPSSLSAVEEQVLTLQKRRRKDARSLRQPASRVLARYVRSFLSAVPLEPARAAGEPVEFLEGWSHIEPDGRWTDGRFAFLAIHAPPQGPPATLSVRALAIRRAAAPAQSVAVYAGLHRIGRLQWSKFADSPYAQEVQLPARVWRRAALVLRLHIGTRLDPLTAGPCGDTRALGICVHGAAIEPPFKDLVASPLDLASDGADHAVLWHGWSIPEAHGCWTHGERAVLRWRAARDLGCGMLEIEVALVAAGQEPMRGHLTFNGGAPQDFAINPGLSPVLCVPLPQPVAAGEAMELKLAIANPRAAACTPEGDTRPLGLSIRRVRIQPGATTA